MIKSRMSTAGARVTGMLCAINCFATFLLLFVLIFSTGHSQAMAASPMTVSSLSFKNNQFLPKQFTGDGSDISPAIQWSGAPASTKSFAVICVDPDAPNGRWIHWVIYDIPSTQTRLPDGADSYAHGGHGFRQGTNSFSKIGWNGPAPPPGSVHHYIFSVYALDALLGDHKNPTERQLSQILKSHVLAVGQITAVYKR